MSDAGRTNNLFKEHKKEIIRYYRDKVYWADNGEILEWNPFNREKILQKMMAQFNTESEFEIERILDDYHKRLEG